MKVVHNNETVIKSCSIVVYARLDLSKARADPLSYSFLDDRFAQRGLF